MRHASTGLDLCTLAFLAGPGLTGSGLAKSAGTAPSLLKLAPEARLEQICDIEAMRRISRDGAHRPDRAIAYALSDPRVEGDTLEASGGAFRSKGKWYGMSFTCRTTPDRMMVESFDYAIGSPIPQEEWPSHGLTQ
jgi:hypothetical protein